MSLDWLLFLEFADAMEPVLLFLLIELPLFLRFMDDLREPLFLEEERFFPEDPFLLDDFFPLLAFALDADLALLLDAPLLLDLLLRLDLPLLFDLIELALPERFAALEELFFPFFEDFFDLAAMV
ncbi:hypothetical protein AGDE_16179 [Angomonas deanei]|uniref:Uncharacterized protein n=1 Tax=Angomonas deanei TaxID=59799 RepID=A0A7G2C4F1_9TRYP|nr:hypothetical protein AGDE_16179 [Angomonas deanei]CAD2213617.1 hypothetical protein, conserved [Angomonas deanei]|eukprot:EPY17599.1 hypothetical protein AGDE_16179 [Angomonas deanei]